MGKKEVTECMHFERIMKRTEYSLKKGRAEDKKRQGQEDVMIRRAQAKNR